MFDNPLYSVLTLSQGGAQEEKYTVVIIKKGDKQYKILEEVEESRAIFEVYEGGVVSVKFVERCTFYVVGICSLCIKALHT